MGCVDAGDAGWGVIIMAQSQHAARVEAARQTKALVLKIILIFLAGLITMMLRRRGVFRGRVPVSDRMIINYRNEMLSKYPTYQLPFRKFQETFKRLWYDDHFSFEYSFQSAFAEAEDFYRYHGEAMPDWMPQQMSDIAQYVQGEFKTDRAWYFSRMKDKFRSDTIDRIIDNLPDLRRPEIYEPTPKRFAQLYNSSFRDELIARATQGYFQDYYADVGTWRDDWFSAGRFENIFPTTLYGHHFRYYYHLHRAYPPQPFFPLSPRPMISKMFPNPWQT